MPNATPANPAVPFSTVLDAELNSIARARGLRGQSGASVPDVADPFEKARQMELAGVAFSGGGIRSATLNLGILQGFANVNLLRHVDYLSTVSGGGYIGSWLTAWIERTQGNLERIENYLSPEESKFPDAEGQQPIHHLRQFSNYLTPNLSVFNADTWSVWAIWSRNTLLNLTILIAGIASLLVVPRLLGLTLLQGYGSSGVPDALPFGIMSGVMLGIATILIGGNLRDVRKRQPRARLARPFWVQIGIIVPAFAAAVLLSCWLRWRPGDFSTPAGILADVLWPTVAFSVLFAVIQIFGEFQECFLDQHKNSRGNWQAAGLALQLGIIVLSAFVTALMFRGLAIAAQSLCSRPDFPWLVLTFGPPVVMLMFALAVIVQIGLMGHDLPDESREWLGTLRAWMMIYSAGWLIFFGASIYGPFWIAAVGGWYGWTGLGVSGTWLLTTAGGLMAGGSSRTSGAAQQPGKTPPNPYIEMLADLAPYVFMVGFVLGISFGVHQLVTKDLTPATKGAPTHTAQQQVQAKQSGNTVTVTLPANPEQQALFPYLRTVQENYWHFLESSQPLIPADSQRWALSGLVFLLAVGIAVTFLMSWRVDINDFSLHHFYRNRLNRCYLGASRKRNPNLLTGFDPADDLRLAELDNPQYSGPFPIINATLNLSSGRNLAWQERMGASYIFTPIYSGYDCGVDNYQESGKRSYSENRSNRRMRIGMGYDAKPPGVSDYAYRKTALTSYAGGIGMGTAMAISGAAANPNSGYHTSTPVAFLMTVFNVRLGWWLGNPRLDKYAASAGPQLGLLYTIKELFGLTDARSGYVNLSDGGHFENLGIYELVRRRCRYIIACDAEQDPTLTFNGLAGAIRKCRTDFGVEIEITLDPITKDGPWSVVHSVLGRIRYPETATEEDRGYLLYLKSSLTGDEPPDVREYQSREPAFPQQSTADQWFDESQFESYRRLGLHIADVVLGSRKQEIAGGLKGLFKGLESIA